LYSINIKLKDKEIQEREGKARIVYEDFPQPPPKASPAGSSPIKDDGLRLRLHRVAESLPIIYRRRTHGLMNMTNKKTGENKKRLRYTKSMMFLQKNLVNETFEMETMEADAEETDDEVADKSDKASSMQIEKTA